MKANLVVLFLFLYFLGFFALRSHAKQGDGFLHYFKGKLQWSLTSNRTTTFHHHATNFHHYHSKKRHLISSEENVDHSTKLAAPVYSQKGLKEKDKIKRLPGQPHKVKFKQYGGYITTNEKTGRALFYYFVEAKSRKNDMPVLLWLNGGPGCSSLGVGAMSELGPFRVGSDGKTLFKNRFTWNKVANLLFLESPAGVGFSYSNTTSEYQSSGDQNTAYDAYVFLLNWFERFPEYRKREFYIAGESYAGHYVPQLAQTILSQNKYSKKKRFINLKGIAVGNPVLTNYEDSFSSAPQFEFFWSHALISDVMFQLVRQACDFSLDVSLRSQECLKAMVESLYMLSHIDKYNIYSSLCQSASLTDEPKHFDIESFDPCNEQYVKAYLNCPEVQEALHANVTRLNYPWISCSEIISSKVWTDTAETILPILVELMDKGIRILVYSGDVDAIIPFSSTRDTLTMLNLKEKTPWYAWNVSNQVGGYTDEYEGGLTFASVRGAGHEVPSYHPRRALTLIKSFLEGVSLPRFTDEIKF